MSLRTQVRSKFLLQLLCAATVLLSPSYVVNAQVSEQVSNKMFNTSSYTTSVTSSSYQSSTAIGLNSIQHQEVNPSSVEVNSISHPVLNPLASLTGSVKQVVDGFDKTVVLKTDGTVWEFGVETAGIPVQVSYLRNIKKISMNYFHTLALREDGVVWAWGSNNAGELGDGTLTAAKKPKMLVDFPNIIDIAAGTQFSLAVRSDGTVWAWGANYTGQLGLNDQTNFKKLYPTQIPNLSDIKSVSAGSEHAFAISNTGILWGWGNNGVHQLGDGTKVTAWAPKLLSYNSNIKEISAGDAHSIALKKDGSVFVWGYNLHNILGDGTNIFRTTPYELTMQLPKNIAAVSAGKEHSSAIDSNGGVYTWGWNHYGVYGDGTSEDRQFPDIVPTLQTNAIAITSGSANQYVVKADGTLWGWGSSGGYKLGSEPIRWWSLVPIPIPGFN